MQSEQWRLKPWLTKSLWWVGKSSMVERNCFYWKQNEFYFPWVVLHLPWVVPFSFALSLLQQWCRSGSWHWLLSSGWHSPGCTDVLDTNVPVLMLNNRAASVWKGDVTNKHLQGHFPYSMGQQAFLPSPPLAYHKRFCSTVANPYSQQICLLAQIPLKLSLNLAVDCWIKGNFSLSPITKDQVSMAMSFDCWAGSHKADLGGQNPFFFSRLQERSVSII